MLLGLVLQLVGARGPPKSCVAQRISVWLIVFPNSVGGRGRSSHGLAFVSVLVGGLGPIFELV